MKRKSPSVAARAGKNEARTAFSYPAGHATVKRFAYTGLTCGICSYYRERGKSRHSREHCSFTGEPVRAGDSCRVDPAVWEVEP